MKAKIILVEAEYPENIGLTARAMKNFGFTELLLVKPKASHLEEKAKSRAMHAKEILEKAAILDSLEKALQTVDYAVATTAKTGKGKKLFRAAMTPKQLAEKFCNSNASIGIVLGRESSGLTNKEIRQCDFIASIPASRQYSTLNVSHAAAIIMHELFTAKKAKKFKTAKTKTIQLLKKKLENTIRESKTIDYKESVLTAGKALISRALITEKEAKALLALFSEFEKK